MGMAGHAMIVARDGSVFAHIHPTGSVPMAAMALVDGAAAMDHSHHHGMVFPPRIRFPYVFPRAGSYRVFVQVKIAGTGRDRGLGRRRCAGSSGRIPTARSAARRRRWSVSSTDCLGS